jgi:hypothetical protein
MSESKVSADWMAETRRRTPTTLAERCTAATLDAKMAAEPQRRANKARRLRQQAIDAGQKRIGR